jgi:nicotinamidase-related amidase
MKSGQNKYYTVCCVLLGLFFFLPYLSTADKGARETSSATEVVIPVRHETYANDDCRFFIEKSRKKIKPNGAEIDDWVRITCKGVRDYLAGIDPKRCALVIVDLQKGCGESWPEDISAVDPDLGKTFADRMRKVVIPNVSRLLEFFRQNDLLILYTTIGDDSIMEGISPSQPRMDKQREFVIQKFSDGAFPTSPIDNILREHGIATVFFVGTDTACCVNATINEAQDRSYQCILIEDGCVASRSELHEAAVKIWAYRAFVRTTDQVIHDYPWQKWVYPDESNSK